MQVVSLEYPGGVSHCRGLHFRVLKPVFLHPNTNKRRKIGFEVIEKMANSSYLWHENKFIIPSQPGTSTAMFDSTSFPVSFA